jgi:uncharacterized membrane protein HdeD (DUF308 family)
MISLDLGIQARVTFGRSWFWLILRGITDLGLGLTLLLGLPMATVAVLLFGDTRQAVSAYGVLLALSFAVAGAGLVAMAFAQRRWEGADAVSDGQG